LSTYTNWPHQWLLPKDIALAGFRFRPTTQSFDNITCSDCSLRLDQWTIDDIPLIEHLRHKKTCSWIYQLEIIDPAFVNYYRELLQYEEAKRAYNEQQRAINQELRTQRELQLQQEHQARV